MNPYDVLGVAPDASDEDIARAYKRLAKQYHPDLHPGNTAAAERMGQINRAYDDIKAMRQRGADPNAWAYQNAQSGGQAYYGNPFDPFFTGRTYYYTYRAPRRSPFGVLVAVLVMFFILRLVLTILFGGYGGYYYVTPGYGNGPGGYYGYGYSQTVPYGN